MVTEFPSPSDDHVTGFMKYVNNSIGPWNKWPCGRSNLLQDGNNYRDAYEFGQTALLFMDPYLPFPIFLDENSSPCTSSDMPPIICLLDMDSRIRLWTVLLCKPDRRRRRATRRVKCVCGSSLVCSGRFLRTLHRFCIFLSKIMSISLGWGVMQVVESHKKSPKDSNFNTENPPCGDRNQTAATFFLDFCPCEVNCTDEATIGQHETTS